MTGLLIFFAIVFVLSCRWAWLAVGHFAEAIRRLEAQRKVRRLRRLVEQQREVYRWN